MQAEEIAERSRPLRLLKLIVEGIGSYPPDSPNVWRLAELKLRSHDGQLTEPERAELKELSAESERLQASDVKLGRPFACDRTLQLFGAEECLRLRSQVEAGDGESIMAAVALCAARGLALPGWLASRFVLRADVVQRGLVKSWSEPGSFGPLSSAGSNRAGVRAVRHEAAEMYRRAQELLRADPSRALDKGFWEEVGERFGYKSASRVEDLVRKHVKAFDLAPLKMLKDLMCTGYSLGQALVAANEQQTYEVFLAAGGTKEQWVELFGDDEGAEASEFGLPDITRNLG